MVNDLTGGGLTPVAAGVAPEAALNLDYFVEWRQWAWTPAVRWVLDPLSKLKGARVLELGPNRGRMSCYLALCGATVTALELDDTPTTDAEREIESWHLGHRVQIQSYDGTGENLPRGPFDFVFTKSVLVLLGDERSSFLSEVASRLSPEGSLLAVENTRGSLIHKLARRRLHPNWRFADERGVRVPGA